MEIMKYAIQGYEDVTAEHLLGIFGNPIKHTLSPVIHDTLSDALGLSERYVPFCVEDEELSHCVKLAYDEGVLGLNITVPHKQHVMESLVDVDIAAKTIGAVNTLVCVEGGYKGYNTDMPGLAKALETEGIALKDETVIMLGAGGAARAVAYMCVSYGAKQVYIVNRTFARAQAIADDMNAFTGKTVVQAVASEDYQSIPDGKYLMIQCTSVGLHEGDGMPFDFGDVFYAMAKAGVDLIYNPAQTPFLKEMEKLGVPAVNGLKMLLYQGILAYELWNNLTVSETLTDKVYLALQDAIYGKKRGDNIVLIGYMGAGKTTVGKALAKKLGYEFIDTDLYIEAQEGMTIPDIFEKKGEAYFRALETDVIRKLREKTHCVIATGGGLPLRKENSDLLKEVGTVYYLMADADKAAHDYWKNNAGEGKVWMDHLGTGYYVPVPARFEKNFPQYSRMQDTGKETKGDWVSLIIDHGKAPKAGSYEYAILPGTDRKTMTAFAKKPAYSVLQQDRNAHILESPSDRITSYVLFETPQSLLPGGLLQRTDTSCLVMVRKESADKVLLTVAQPDLALYRGPSDEAFDKDGKRMERSIYSRPWIDNESGEIPVTVTLKGRWKVAETPFCKVVSEDKKQTVLRFLCKDGASYEVELEK